MFTIRNEQMHMLGLAAQEGFVERIMAMLRRDYAEQFAAKPEDDLRTFVRTTLDEAMAKRIVAVGAVMVYFELVVEYGDWLRCSPDSAWAESILSHPTLPDQLRVSMVRDRFSERTQGRRIAKA